MFLYMSTNLRTGMRMTTDEWLLRHERKFNPYHDPKNGQFTFGPGGSNLGRTNPRPGKSTGRRTPAMSQKEVEARADHAMQQYRRELARGKTPEEAAAWAANSEAESRGDPSAHQEPKGPGRGLFQWGSTKPQWDRRPTFQRVMNLPIEQATADQQLDFRDWELRNTHKSTQRHIDAALTVAAKSTAITNLYLGPADKIGAAEDRARIAEAIYRKAKMK